MGKKFGNVWVTIIGLILLVYTASRSYEFLAMTFPPDKAVLAFAGLIALDGGIIAWLRTYQSTGIGLAQRAIAASMILIDFVGSALTFIADTLYNTGKVGMTFELASQDMWTIILVVSLIIAANVGASVAFHMLDPESQKKRALSDARAEVDEEAIRLVKNGTAEMAAKIAPQMAASMLDEHSANLKIQVSETRTRTKRLQATAARIDPDYFDPLPAQQAIPEPLPAQTARQTSLPAQTAEALPLKRKVKTPEELEEEELLARQQTPIMVELPANPTPRPNGRH